MTLLSDLSAFTVFLAICGAGFLLLMVALLFGGLFDFFEADHDFDSGGPGFFSTRVMAVFVTTFGGAGAVATYYGLSAVPAALVGFATGLVFGGAIYALARMLYQQQAAPIFSPATWAEGRAEAAKIEAIGLAQAKAIEAQGTAEAAAILRKAEAWKEFNDAARLQTVLEKLPAIIEASSGVFAAVAAPMGTIDKMVVIDQGAGNGDGSTSLARLAQTSPALVFSLLQQLEALGLNVPSVLQQLGVNPAAAAPVTTAGVSGVVVPPKLD